MRTNIVLGMVGVAIGLLARADATQVVTEADAGPGSLREAIANPSDETITFAPNVKVIALTTGALKINRPLTIIGPPERVTIRCAAPAEQTSRLFEVNSENVTLRYLTLRDGRPGTEGESGGGAIMNRGVLTLEKCVVADNEVIGSGPGAHVYGGAIYNASSLILRDSTFRGNRVHTAGAGGHNYGGAVYCLWGSPLVVERCTFEDNRVEAYHGAGGAVCFSGSATFVNSTFSGNLASSYGGALYVLYPSSADLLVQNCTISGNHAREGGGIYFLWPVPEQRPFVIRNNILVDNSATTDGADIYNLNTIHSAGHNLIGQIYTVGSGAFTLAAGDQLGVSRDQVKLDPLQANGGFTRTRAIDEGSIAIDSGDDANSPAIDQRGVIRPQRARCDIGAFERGADPGDSIEPAATICLDPASGTPRFGAAISMDVDTLFVGAPEDEDFNGTVRLHYRQGDNFNEWRPHQTLHPTYAGQFNRFGAALSFDHRSVAIGTGFRGGPVFVFERESPGLDWNQAAVIETPEDTELEPGALSLSDDTLAIGGANTGPLNFSGSVLVYERSAAQWHLKQTLVPSDPQEHAAFGKAVTVLGSHMIVGAPGSANGAGAVYLFARRGLDWVEVQKLVSPAPRPGGHFGRALATNIGEVIIGEPTSEEAPGIGKVFVFAKEPATPDKWLFQQELIPKDLSPDTHFGVSLAIDGNNRDIIVGQLPFAASIAEQRAGAAYVFTIGANGWQQRFKLAPTQGQRPDAFGYPVVAGSAAFAVGNSLGASGAGCVTIYGLATPNRAPLFTACPESMKVPTASRDGAEITLNASVLDEDGDTLRVQWEIDGSIVSEEEIDGSWRFTRADVQFKTLLSLGAHDVRILLRDGTAAPVVCAFRVTVGDNRPPRVRIISPGDGSAWRSGQTIALVAEAFDPDGQVQSIEFFAGSSSLGNATRTNRALFRLEWATATAGDYVLTAKATDNSGASAVSGMVHISVVEQLVIAVRHLPRSYRPGGKFRPRLSLNGDSEIGVVVEDRPPVGWLVSHVSHGGVYDPLTGTVRFGPFTDGRKRVLGYQVTVPDSATGPQHFRGRVLVGTVEHAIGGEQVIEQTARRFGRALAGDARTNR